jgi:hypothetical protein
MCHLNTTLNFLGILIGHFASEMKKYISWNLFRKHNTLYSLYTFCAPEKQW